MRLSFHYVRALLAGHGSICRASTGHRYGRIAEVRAPALATRDLAYAAGEPRAWPGADVTSRRRKA